jgi:CheY-like chemotaxis protein
MLIVRDSAEHHLITTLQTLKDCPKGWMAAHFALSRLLPHDELMKDINAIGGKLQTIRQTSLGFFEDLLTKASGFKEAIAYIFPDNDVLLLARPHTPEEKQALQTVYEDMAGTIDKKFSDYVSLAAEFYSYQKFSDHKFLMAQRMRAYEQMADDNKVASIGLRRQKRGYPMVLVVEDDRFTSSYAAHILNNNFEVILSRSGEQGIADYIEHAPDIVFLDIHMPGLSGHDTLQSIRAIDPKAFIVMLSVDTVKKNITQAAENGAYSFLRKPFSKEKMIEMVKRSPHIQCATAYAQGLSPSAGKTSLH